MDQIKIGIFIAEKRKEKHITQRELADKLGITDRAVSKWECGRSLPDSALMIPLCEILGISVNELLLGRALEKEDYRRETEKLLLEMKRKEEESNRYLLKLEMIERWVVLDKVRGEKTFREIVSVMKKGGENALDEFKRNNNK